jgi:hypothetical protein
LLSEPLIDRAAEARDIDCRSPGVRDRSSDFTGFYRFRWSRFRGAGHLRRRECSHTENGIQINCPGRKRYRLPCLLKMRADPALDPQPDRNDWIGLRDGDLIVNESGHAICKVQGDKDVSSD